MLLVLPAAEEELQKQKNYDPWGRPGAGAPPPKSEPEAEPEPAKQFKTEEVCEWSVVSMSVRD